MKIKIKKFKPKFKASNKPITTVDLGIWTRRNYSKMKKLYA